MKNKQRKTHWRDMGWGDDSEEEASRGGSFYEEGLLGSSVNSVRYGGGAGSLSRAFESIVRFKPAPPMKPRNAMQEKYVQLIESPTNHIVVSSGSAGTGKTFVANSLGIQKLLDGTISKLIITRPVVSVDESVGYLPGDLESKLRPWMMPIYDVFHKYISPQQLQKLIAQEIIEICPLGFMRGRSFENAWILADEMQNSTPNQMLMLLTRIGSNSKLIINGDPSQHDRGYDNNGLSDLLNRLQRHPQDGIEVVRFTEEHVERHPVVKKVLRMYQIAAPPSF